MKKSLLIIFVLFSGFACQPEENHPASIENDLQPTFYIEGEKPEPFTLQERMEHYNVPGVSVAVFRNEKLEWAKGYGIADKEANRPVTARTLFQAASISKPIAAMAVHDMAEEGIIDLDTNINEYLTSWQLPENEFTAVEKVTLRRILNHSAGTTVWGFPGYSRTEEIPDAVGVVSGMGNTDSISVFKTPGESWQYSGGGYTVMQIALADVEGKPFEEIMAERVLIPLEMNSSTYEQPLPEDLYDHAATGYRGNGSEVEGKWHVYPEQAAAGLWTTPTDIGRYAVSIQKTLHGEANPVLAQTTVQEMLTPGDNNHALGPGIRFDGAYFGHGGANEGYRNDFVASMEGGNVVVIMTNSDSGGPLVSELMHAIFRHYGWPELQPTVKTKVDLAADYLESFAGQYNIPELGDVNLALEDSALVVRAEFIQNPIILAAENDSTLFDVSDGTPFHFNFSDGSPTGFEVQGFTASKVSDQ